MEENKRRYDELSEYMKKIQESMQISNQRKEELDKLQQELNEETRIMMVDKEKEQIESKKLEKAEFDEMTVNAMVNAKKDILELKQDIEKEYIDKLLQMQSEEKEIESKFNRMQQRGLDKEKMDWAIQSRDKAITDLQNEKQKYQAEHENQMKNLQDWEMDIEKYAKGLDVLDKIDNVRITAPASTPTTPVSTPTTPVSTPTTPVSTPTAPASTPTRPVSTPTAPASTPTAPVSTPSTPVKAKIKGIKIGKQLEIEYENSDKKSVKIDFKRMKQLMKQTPEEKEKMVREVLKNSNIRNISKETLKLIDPNVIYAFQNAKKHKVEEKDVEEQVLGYIYALKGDKNYQDKLRGLITYDRTGMDYWKPSTFFSKIVNGKWYKKLDSYSNKAKDFTDVIFDLPGKLRMALGKKDTKLLEKTKESTVDRNKRISEKATQELSGNSQRTEQKKNIRKDVKVSDEVAKKLRKVEEEFKKQETVRDSIKSDTYKKMEEKASKEGFSK